MSVILSTKANCKNCYKCVRVCPVKAIKFEDNQAEVLPQECIFCGACVLNCPQQAKTVANQMDKVRRMIREGQKVVASVAPSFPGSLFSHQPMKLPTALRALGFYQARETADGAARVSDAYVELAADGKMDNIITTCCPSVNDLIEKYHPTLVDAMAPVISPMVAHARAIKKELGPEVKVVFIGPCIAKMEEAEDVRHLDAVNAVLTFADIIGWLKEAKIDVDHLEESPFDGVQPGMARMYPTAAGILENVRLRGINPKYHMLHVEGAQSCEELLQALEAGQLHDCFIEMNMCEGACMGGPMTGNVKHERFKGQLAVQALADGAQVKVPEISDKVPMFKQFVNRAKKDAIPDAETIRSILRSMGKECKMDELNCGSCGYPSCRAKAIAVYQGKADPSMCMPYMFQSAQSFSNVVMENTPNLILLVDEELKIKEMNKAASQVFGMSRTEALNHYIFELIEADDFQTVLNNYETIRDKKVSYPAYNMTASMTLVYIPSQRAVMAILRDITAEEERESREYKLKLDTVEMAQKVISKQMVAAQEIASLLGETTAETKSTLTRLKNMIINDGEGKK